MAVSIASGAIGAGWLLIYVALTHRNVGTNCLRPLHSGHSSLGFFSGFDPC